MPDWLKRLFGSRPQADSLGRRGENIAARFLRNQGYKIIQRNFNSGAGELDIVAKLGNMLVFVEVKTRTDDDPTPETQVDDFKRNQLTKAARIYLSRYGQPQPPARFDVVAIVWPPNQQPRIRHTVNAFDATF
jgi:putative endonuclease